MAEIYKAIHVHEEIDCMPMRPIRAAEHTRDEGYEAGYADGFSKGVLQEQASLLGKTTTLNGLISNIPAAINENRLQLSTDIANIVLTITAQLFSHQQQDKTAIARQVTQIIEQLNEAQHINIALHPQDWAILQETGFTETIKQYTQLQFTPDAQLLLGGCVVSSEHGLFDASIERQIDNLKQVLLQMKCGHGDD